MAPVPPSHLRHHIAARTRFFDQQVLDAIDHGIDQIVILGAGYDDRALRFRTPGVRFFELDQPATQADKQHRLEDLHPVDGGPILVPVDFRHDDVAAALAHHGHDAALSSLFVCEGLLVYLDEPTIVGLLNGLRTRATAGTHLAASLAVHDDGLHSVTVVVDANARRSNARKEPWRTMLPPTRHRALLAEGGWTVTAAFEATAFDPRALPGRSLLTVAVPR